MVIFVIIAILTAFIVWLLLTTAITVLSPYLAALVVILFLAVYFKDDIDDLKNLDMDSDEDDEIDDDKRGD